jgi:hypothetical protein
VGAEEDVAGVAGELPHPDVPVPLTPHPTVLQLGRPALLPLAKRKIYIILLCKINNFYLYHLLQRSRPESVILLRSPGIDFLPGGSV